MRIVPFLLLAACGGHFRVEHVGQGSAAIAVRGTEPAPAAGIALPRGNYDFALRFDVPRAQEIEWRVTCPGGTTTGSAGESFEHYRERRLAELRQDKERERATAGAVANLIVGAVAPPATVHADGPNASVDAHVDPGAAAGTAVANSIDTNVDLPPGDVGAGRVTTVVHLSTPEDGTCSVAAIADDANVLGGFEVTRVRDLDAEARARREAEVSAQRDRERKQIDVAVRARGQLSAQLVAWGADPELRERQLAERAAAEARAGAEARARAEAELRVHAEVQARAEAEASAKAEAELRVREEHRRAQLAIEIRVRTTVVDVRTRLRAQLVAWGADAGLRARLALRAQEEREARDAELRIRLERERAAREARIAKQRAAEEARLQSERARQAQIDAELARQEQERMRLEARRLQIAMTARAEMRAYLVSIGARERPPMPPMIAEAQGSAPFSGAVWIAGHWTWSGAEWSWVRGGWRDTSVSFGATGGDNGSVAIDAVATPVETVIETPVVVQTPIVVQPPVVDPTVRDHRTVETSRPATPVRDHRTVETSRPAVRDHRDEKKQDPKVRDHR